jgi:membrane protein
MVEGASYRDSAHSCARGRGARRTGLGAAFEWTWKILQWPLVFALVATALGVLNYFGPDTEREWEWVTPGAVLGTILWLLASLAFRFYVTNLADYNATYGSLGGVIVLMLWFYISGLAILAGAEINAEIEHASAENHSPRGENLGGAHPERRGSRRPPRSHPRRAGSYQTRGA